MCYLRDKIAVLEERAKKHDDEITELGEQLKRLKQRAERKRKGWQVKKEGRYKKWMNDE